LHLGYLGCYGGEWVRTPYLDRLASEGVVFDQHYADCPVLRRQFRGLADAEPHRSWWTGRYWFPEPGGREQPGGDEAARFFALLEAQGITTLRIISQSRMEDFGPSPSLQFPRRRLLQALAGAADRSRLLVWVDLPSLAPPWPVLSGRHLRPYFPAATAEDGEPLTPWADPPQGVVELARDNALERLQATYAAALTYFDAQVGRLLQDLRAQGWYDDLLLLVTADRGLALGEHGVIGEAPPELHEELVHLPLLVRWPRGQEAGRRVAALTQPVDLLPTLLEALAVPLPPVHGRSLLPLARGEAAEVRAYTCAGLGAGAGQYLLRTPNWSLHLSEQAAPEAPARSPQLYVKPDDRWEVNDVLQHHQELAQRLEQTLRAFVSATRQPGPLQAPQLAEEK